MPKTPGTRQIGIEISPRGMCRWYLVSGNGKPICHGCWRWGDARNSGNAFIRLLKDKPVWIKQAAPTNQEEENKE